ncbi:MAG: helix-turn-helix transcriptional regulator [Clostridia bacterium]|nr:helix-turn-helix transcriptional regulator [Clostridia bacterium]
MSKNNENVYYMARKKSGCTREKAAELLESIPPERIERIENNKFNIHPDEVIRMAEVYKDPTLCNHYCSNECPIGMQYVPEIKIKDLTQIVLEMLSSLNSMKKSQERLIEITADGVIDDTELTDFIFIQQELERISVTVETLQLWAEQMIAEGKIDMDKYNAIKNA